MTIAIPAPPMRLRGVRFDLSWPVLIGIVVILCVLIVLPLSWLVAYSLTDRTGAFTLANFSCPGVRPGVRRAVRDDADHRRRRQRRLLRRGGADGLAGGAHRPAADRLRAHAGDGVLRDAAVSRRRRLGAAGGAQFAACSTRLYRAATGAEMDAYLFNIYSLPGLIFVISCYTFPYVFVLVANALDRIPGDLEDASVHARRPHLDDGAAHHHPAGAAGARRRRPGRLPAGDDAVRLAGDPGAAGRLPHHDHQDLEPVPVSAQAGAGRRRRRCRCWC